MATRVQPQPNAQPNAQVPNGAAHFTGQNSISFSDHRIIEVLAASGAAHRKLLQTARSVPDVLSGPSETGGELVENVELYGSLSLDMDEPETAKGAERQWTQDWPSYYVNSRSDVDFVVELKQNVSPDDICARLQKEGWGVVGQTHVRKFETAQYTLVGTCDEDDDGNSGEVYLDVTCIKSSAHYSRFKRRQEAFREAFHEVRSRMEAQFGSHGALAFDAYIHLLKAFAAKVPGNALTGFQATCIGLFTLQIGHFRLKPTQSIALSLFEGFLRFCQAFYGDVPATRNSWSQQALNYRYCAIDLSVGGRWLTRVNMCWRSELYFMATEVKLRTSADERVNVAHSLVPASVAAEAASLLQRAFSGTFDWNGAFSPIAVSG